MNNGNPYGCLFLVTGKYVFAGEYLFNFYVDFLKKKTFLNFRNNLVTLYKNTSPDELRKIIIKRMLLDGLSGLRFLSQFKFKDFFAILRAHFEFYSKISELKQFRKEENKL